MNNLIASLYLRGSTPRPRDGKPKPTPPVRNTGSEDKPSNKTHKRCIVCREWKPRQDILDDAGEIVERHGFGSHNSSDGLQSICQGCKNDAGKKERNRDVSKRLRHHMATRALKQLGDLAPSKFTKNLEDYLGYRMKSLVRHLRDDLKEREGPERKLRDALDEGYHVDHRRPLSSFAVIVEWDGVKRVDWAAFKECWAITNLSAIPSQENLVKGATWDPTKAEF